MGGGVLNGGLWVGGNLKMISEKLELRYTLLTLLSIIVIAGFMSGNAHKKNALYLLVHGQILRQQSS